MSFLQPRYKKLAHNDTGSAVGHQGGPLIPKDLANYFPVLTGTVSASSPTLDVGITAELVLGSSTLGVVNTRYQYQTWGGTRRAERRITGNLQDLLSTAAKDDLLVIERDAVNAAHYRLTLHKLGSAGYAAVAPKLGQGRWGKVS